MGKSARKGAAGTEAARPRLLAGGNPQIPKGDGDGPVQAYLAAMPGWKRDVGRHIDGLVERTVPRVRKAVRWNTPFYGIKDRGWFLAFHCFTRYVKVTLLNGASLRPLPPVESQAGARALFPHPRGRRIRRGALVGWIERASALPGEEVF